MTRWSAPVRFAEVDAQGVVFNSHYLLYADEAMGAFCDERGLRDFAARVQLVTSKLTWTAAAHWGDVVDVDTSCIRLGRSSFDMAFDIQIAGATCCRIETTYVLTNEAGASTALSEAVRAALQS